MTPRQWRLRKPALDTVATSVGLDDSQLASLLGVTAAELRPVVGYLIGTRQLDVCHGYLVIPAVPAAAPAVSAA